MTNREKDLTNKGYRYYTETESNDKAKESAKALRETGKKATVLVESRRGVPYYSVWCK